MTIDNSLSSENAILTISVDPTGLKYPILVDPSTISSTRLFSDGDMAMEILPRILNSKNILSAYFSIEIVNEIYYMDDYGEWVYEWDWAPYSGQFYARTSDNQTSFFLGDVRSQFITLTGNEIRKNMNTNNNVEIYGIYYQCNPYYQPSYVEGYFSITYTDDLPPSSPSELKYNWSERENWIDLSWRLSEDDLSDMNRYDIYLDTEKIGSIIVRKKYYDEYEYSSSSSSIIFKGTDSNKIMVQLHAPVTKAETFLKITAVDTGENKSEAVIQLKAPPILKYVYNSLGQLESIVQYNTVKYRFFYDSNGNLITISK